jgi:hypothetical protein
MKRTIVYSHVLIYFSLFCVFSRLDAQEEIISKKDADYVFGLTKPEWERVSIQYFAPGWTMKSVKFDSGSLIIGFDSSTGKGLSIQPLYKNDREPPEMVILGNYFPMDALPPMTDELKRDMEKSAQKDLGPGYLVRLTYTKMEGIQLIEFLLSRKQ